MSNTKDILANKDINFPRVQVLNSAGEHKGIMLTPAALKLAEFEALDLIAIDTTQDPPVCRIMDFGKYLYEKNKRSHVSKQKPPELKEIQLTPRIGEHDLEIKIRKINEFLHDGHRIKLSMRLKGRESSHIDITQSIWEKIEASITGHFTERPKNEFNRSMIAQIAPGKLVVKNKPASSKPEKSVDVAAPTAASENMANTAAPAAKPSARPSA